MATQHFSRSRALSEGAAEAETLLNRYPEISEQELDTMIRTFTHLPLLDFGLLAADERLGGKLDAFYADHGDKLRPPLSGMVWAIAVPVLIVAIALIYSAVT
ncbi:hypothetical protein KK137_04825 [Croceibacterium sp. LX-88]|jgi:hypothetical protein|uniref:Uncharacterized protein n=1 Tax=Croceibacterium selenioxidans TaxID=2838833 RepID=A0ABS5W2D8_9SPHN|nr:hypothetical protein [Croceibacterium selenioxidans]MBT2133651.1 hypothetical protein [Croceibacterium selenioxidans]